jgi:hypothetical protein
LVIVDHLNTMRAANAKCTSESYESIHENTMRLWEMTASEGCATLLCTQITKESYKNGMKDGRPTLSCLKGAGTPIEKAKIIYFVHSKEEEMTSPNQIVKRELVIAKANDGGLGYIPAFYIKPNTLTIEESPENRRDFADLFERYCFDGQPPSQTARITMKAAPAMKQEGF